MSKKTSKTPIQAALPTAVETAAVNEALRTDMAAHALGLVKSYPYLVVKGRTRYAVAIKEDDERAVTVLHMEDGFYDVKSVSRIEFLHEYQEVEFLNLKTRVPASLEHFIEVMASTTIEVSQAALDALKEIQTMQSAIIVNKQGHIVEKSAPDTIIITYGSPTNAARLSAFLTERTRGVFVKEALGLDVAPARIKDGDERIAQAIKKMVGEQKQVVSDKVVGAVGKKVANRTAAASKPTGEAAAPRGPSLKQRLHDALVEGKRMTSEAFAKHLAGNEVSVKTALSDLKNPKYAINGKALNIVKDDKGVYGIAKK